MHLKMNQDGVNVLAPAKINLHLEILQKRSDGYHEIETIMHAVNLYDTLQVHKRDDGNVTLELHTPAGRANERSSMDLDPHQIDSCGCRFRRWQQRYGSRADRCVLGMVGAV
jgi:4-diphosphocytidyl-2-C-methyl-D-erythritol kinase